MNAKQRRRFVRQYKERIHTDMAIRRLEGWPLKWFDPKDPGLHNDNYTPFRYYMYALYLKATDETI